MVKVLLVDDDALVRSNVALQMETVGHEVVQAADADEALMQLRDGSGIELVVTDVRMPGRLDGFGLADELARANPTLPVLLISGNATEDDLRRHGRSARRQFLAKPFRFKALSEKIRLCVSASDPQAA